LGGRFVRALQTADDDRAVVEVDVVPAHRTLPTRAGHAGRS
jgi:hypothetical protein